MREHKMVGLKIFLFFLCSGNCYGDTILLVDHYFFSLFASVRGAKRRPADAYG
jgi:hypothetical protein